MDPHAGLIVEALIECHERLKRYDLAEAWRRKWLAVVKRGTSGPESLAIRRRTGGIGIVTLCRAEKMDRRRGDVAARAWPIRQKERTWPPGRLSTPGRCSASRSTDRRNVPRPSRCSYKAMRGLDSVLRKIPKEGQDPPDRGPGPARAALTKRRGQTGPSDQVAAGACRPVKADAKMQDKP